MFLFTLPLGLSLLASTPVFAGDLFQAVSGRFGSQVILSKGWFGGLKLHYDGGKSLVKPWQAGFPVYIATAKSTKDTHSRVLIIGTEKAARNLLPQTVAFRHAWMSEAVFTEIDSLVLQNLCPAGRVNGVYFEYRLAEEGDDSVASVRNVDCLLAP